MFKITKRIISEIYLILKVWIYAMILLNLLISFTKQYICKLLSFDKDCKSSPKLILLKNKWKSHWSYEISCKFDSSKTDSLIWKSFCNTRSTFLKGGNDISVLFLKTNASQKEYNFS